MTKSEKIITLGIEWKRNPQFKESCRKNWDPVFFSWCEKKIEELNQIQSVESKHLKGDSVELLDVTEISVEGW